MRNAQFRRETGETDVFISLELDGSGKAESKTGMGFLDHMLTLLAKHGSFDMTVECHGDTWVDFHHSTEDIGICLGKAFREALGEKKGITRYGDILLPMDEALVLMAVDISGRGGFYGDLNIPTEKVGEFDTELCAEFFRAFTRESGITVHLRQLAGENSHHIIEACFKAAGRSLSKAVAIDARNAGKVPSTKGVLE